MKRLRQTLFPHFQNEVWTYDESKAHIHLATQSLIKRRNPDEGLPTPGHFQLKLRQHIKTKAILPIWTAHDTSDRMDRG